jgi:beta-glucanase (GH16 family)
MRTARLALAIWSVVSIAATAWGADKPIASILPSETKWTLSFADEFDGDKLDTKKWSPHDHGVFIRNNELQAYVPEALSVRDGLLRVTAEKRQQKYAGKLQEYTSGMMITRDKFSQQYGFFEIRCRCPAGKGLWPAYWMLEERTPQPWPPEIDILEFLGHQPTTMYFTLHWKSKQEKSGRKASHHKLEGPAFTKDFHIIGCEWNANEVKWYCDGKQTGSHAGEGVPHVPMYLMVNLAVGGNWPGAPDDKTPFPSAFEVDFVRAYKAAE